MSCAAGGLRQGERVDRSFGVPGSLALMARKDQSVVSERHPTKGDKLIVDDLDGRLRPAGDADRAVLLELADAFYRETGFNTSREELHANLRALMESDSAHVAVYDRANRILGFAVTTTTLGLEAGLVAELQDLYVEPGRRRQGIAAQLLNDAAAWAADAGARDLEVVIAGNGADVSHLHDYYDDRGFIDNGRRLRSRRLVR